MKRLFLSFAAVLLCIGTIEIVARLYDRVSPPPPERGDISRGFPPPYADAPYLTEEFGAEAIALARQIHSNESGPPVLKDFSGRFFNVHSGMRATTDQPGAYTNAIHLLGGSTVFAAEVPDSYTIPSVLQALLRKRYGDRFIVFNRGMPGFTARAQTELLRTLSLNRGDVVVYYDGTNEVSHSIFYGSADPEIARRGMSSPDTWSLSERVTHRVWTYLNPYSCFVRRFCDVEKNARWAVPPHLENAGELERLLAGTRSSYLEAIRAAKTHSSAQGALFVHFLQPTIFAQQKLTAYEEKLIRNHNLVLNGMQIAHQAGYPVLKGALREADGEIVSYDLTGVFDARPNGEEYFLDDCHVAHGGNAILAQQIYDKLVALIDGAQESWERAADRRP